MNLWLGIPFRGSASSFSLVTKLELCHPLLAVPASQKLQEAGASWLALPSWSLVTSQIESRISASSNDDRKSSPEFLHQATTIVNRVQNFCIEQRRSQIESRISASSNDDRKSSPEFLHRATTMANRVQNF
jgi:hypothetical protein